MVSVDYDSVDLREGVIYNALDRVKYLVNQGVDPNVPYKATLCVLERPSLISECYVSFLHVAVFSKPSILSYLLDFGCDPHFVDTALGLTPLQLAKKNDKHEHLSLLTEKVCQGMTLYQLSANAVCSLFGAGSAYRGLDSVVKGKDMGPGAFDSTSKLTVVM